MMVEYGMTGGLGWISMFLWWAIIIFAIGYVLKWLIGYQKNDAKKNDRALEVLRERYARGEINEEQFLKNKKVLSE